MVWNGLFIGTRLVRHNALGYERISKEKPTPWSHFSIETGSDWWIDTVSTHLFGYTLVRSEYRAQGVYRYCHFVTILYPSILFMLSNNYVSSRERLTF